MLTAIIYNCPPDTLDEMNPDEFTQALAAEVRKLSRYRECLIEVQFDPNEPSGLLEFTSTLRDEIANEATYREEVRRAGERAFAAVCAS